MKKNQYLATLLREKKPLQHELILLNGLDMTIILANGLQQNMLDAHTTES